MTGSVRVRDIRPLGWWYIIRRTFRAFIGHHCIDLAAGLTYFGVLAVFPALLAVVSVVGLVGDPESTTETVLGLLDGLIPASTIELMRGPLGDLARSPAAGVTFALGLAGALWTVSGYVTAFCRAMNRIYRVEEGRPFWKLRPTTLGITAVGIVGVAIAALVITASGPLADRLGEALGLGAWLVTIWDVAKWPVLAILVAAVVATMYYLAPNVRQPRFRWLSPGALAALLVGGLASAGFAFYAGNFARYNETYGSIGAVIVFLLWVWITNLALLFGAVLDAELERGRELHAGLSAEERLQLPLRDDRRIQKRLAGHRKAVARSRWMRVTSQAGRDRSADHP